jgi:hypothetical protein
MRRNAILLLGALSLTLLAGCGTSDAKSSQQAAGGAADTQESRTSKADADWRKKESLIADCMKKQGFQYVPDLRMLMGDDQIGKFGGPQSVLLPAEQVRTFRQKYGFGQYAALAYPNDPAVAQKNMDPDTNPNKPLRDALDPARRKAYELALHGTADGGDKTPAKGTTGCDGEASLTIWPGGQDEETNRQAVKKAHDKFLNDPAVVAAADKYATCLRGKGYQVKSTLPGEIEASLSSAATEAAFKARGSADAAAAKAGLDKEIKAALADLDCRADYANIVRTKYADAILNGNGAG